jgi:hypothetical protein
MAWWWSSDRNWLPVSWIIFFFLFDWKHVFIIVTSYVQTVIHFWSSELYKVGWSSGVPWLRSGRPVGYLFCHILLPWWEVSLSFFRSLLAHFCDPCLKLPAQGNLARFLKKLCCDENMRCLRPGERQLNFSSTSGVSEYWVQTPRTFVSWSGSSTQPPSLGILTLVYHRYKFRCETKRIYKQLTSVTHF